MKNQKMDRRSDLHGSQELYGWNSLIFTLLEQSFVNLPMMDMEWNVKWGNKADTTEL